MDENRTGVTRALYFSDRARQEFSNATLFLELSHHAARYGIQGEWIFQVEYHGKAVVDGLGAGIKRLLYRECTASSKIMSPVEAVQRLQQRTKSRLVRGRFAKFTQYRFTLLEEDKVKALSSGATVKGTTQYYHYKYEVCHKQTQVWSVLVWV